MRAAIGWRVSTIATLFSMGLIVATPSPSRAQIAVSGPSNFVDEYGVNPIGTGAAIGWTGFYDGGTYDSVGLQSVSPVSGTTVRAAEDGALYNIPFLGGGAFPTQFYNNLPLDPSLTGAWTLTVVNSSESNSPLTVDTPALTVAAPPRRWFLQQAQSAYRGVCSRPLSIGQFRPAHQPPPRRFIFFM
jgi:hypothetical protein